MATVTITTQLESVLTNVTSVELSNAAATIGIKRNDTNAVVVAAGTALTNSATGTYTYAFTAPSEHTFYTAYVKIVASGNTLYREIVFYVSKSDASVIVPSEIVSQYLISTLSSFSAPSASTTWPLYISNLPDGTGIAHNAAAIYDTTPDLQGKHMGGELDQRYGIQIILRSTDHEAGYEKLKAVLSAIQNTHQADEIVGGTTFRIDNFSTTSGVFSLGVEEGTKQRYLFSLNLLVTIRGL